MEKKEIIINNPERCSDCIYYNDDYEYDQICVLSHFLKNKGKHGAIYFEDCEELYGIHKNCPLKKFEIISK